MDSEKKYYWLKLKRDFFKRHDIRIVEEMPNGKDYILFYLKMLVESVDHEGGLRFNDTIPYNDEMLATITNTNIDIVRAAMALFTELGMIEILDNGTIYMSEVLKMIGSAASSDNAIRQQRFRDKKRQEVAELAESVTGSVTKSNASVTQAVTNSNESKSKSKSKSIKENIEEKSVVSLIPQNSSEKLLTDTDKMFLEFWDAYPRKVDKTGSERAFKRIPKLKEVFPDIMNALQIQKNSEQWNKNNGQFIPHPTTYIHQQRWETVTEHDELQTKIDEIVKANIDGFLV